MFAASKTASVSAAVPDGQFNYVTLLLHGDGTNGAQNNTFIDSSTNNFSITRNGNTTQGSFSPYGSNWSNSFNGTNSYLTLSSNASMSFGTGNFTIEGWFFTGDKSISGGANRMIVGNSGNSYTMQLYIDSSGFLTFGNTGSTFIQGSTDLANNTWHHFAISRSGTSTNQIAMWVDGTRVAQGTNSQNYTSGTIYIGAFGTTDGFWNGYISNLRIVNGSAVYDPANSTITVPTTPLTAITNTALLTCQANRFFDASANAYTVTATGSPSVQRFNPFGTSTAYSTSVIGGSGYFDGSGDYLGIANNTALQWGTGDFCVEMWVNPSSAAGGKTVVCKGTNNTGTFEVGIYASNKIELYTTALVFTSTASAIANAWTHIAITRSGTTLRCFINGALDTTVTSSYDFNNTSTFYVGIYGDVTSNPFNGYISNVRCVKGSAVYTAAFTPNTAPLTAITNTQLLLNTTNGAIFDNAMMNDLETVGDAQISTSIVKYGTGSIKFDGNGDWLIAPYNQGQNFGTGNFTIEGWFYLNNLVNNYYVIAGPWTSGTTDEWLIQIQNNGDIRFLTSVGTSFYAASIAATTWYHFAAVRNGTSIILYINGTSVGSYTNSNSIGSTSKVLYIGVQNAGSWALNGYIDDFRISKYARYTTTFTPPTAAFPNTGPY